jgi:peptide/nickel transport system substrate-binding protein
LKQQLVKIGIDVTIETFDRAATIQKVYHNWDYDVMLQLFTTGPDPTISVTRVYNKNNIGKAPFNNVMAYQNSDVQQLLDTEWQQLDEKKRGEAWKKIADLVAQDVPAIPLYYVPVVNTYSAKWRDVITRADGQYQSREDAYLAK